MTEAIQPSIDLHKGLIREDLLVLRYLLGLRLSHSLQTPTLCRELPNTSMKDVIFLAVDTEAFKEEQIHLVKRFQIGVSILDTRVLQNLISAHPLTTLEQPDLLQTRNFCVGPLGYCSKASRRFLFGQSETVNPDQIKTQINDIIYDRDVVLVVHGGSQDLWFLKELNIDLKPVSILDTQKAAQQPLQLCRRCSLQDLLVTLDCPFKFLHTAGNDANFTLRALLMIAVKDSQDIIPGESEQVVLSAIQAIAQSLGTDNWLEIEEDGVKERQAELAEQQEKNYRKRERKREKRLARKDEWQEQGHWSASKGGRKAFYAEKLKTEEENKKR